ncbi:hypothetical protein CL631_01555 [bacterium]|jgi:hypothetical protein|nr:hypothetical protein [bacterium]|tara:strand:- start:26290 stop:26556 length:267 start_codon:yes stop_codon:yes gene_type:complete
MNFREYFQSKDLKKTPNVGLHYEQKFTPDLLWSVAHTVLDFTNDDTEKVFEDKDIRESQIFGASSGPSWQVISPGMATYASPPSNLPR